MLRSSAITKGIQRSPNRAMLRAVGFGDNDFEKPIIGIANGYSTITPCNMGLMELARKSEEAIKKANLLIDDAAKFGFRSLVPFLALSGIPGFIVSAITEVATAKGLNEDEVELFKPESESIGDQVMKNVGDFSGPSASSILLEKLSQDATMKAGGGIMNINDMIKPIGK